MDDEEICMNNTVEAIPKLRGGSNNDEIKIEVKRRKGSPWVDITKSQWNISDIISVCDEENEEFHMLTKKRLEEILIAKLKY